MILTKHRTREGARWAVDHRFLPPGMTLSTLLEMRRGTLLNVLAALRGGEHASGEKAAPIDPCQEVWAAGVTYLRSRDARRSESSAADLYDHVYESARPELFFKSTGWRVAGHQVPIRIRRDSGWNVPEPELVLVINAHREIVGYCAGNDVSSRSIEGENPLFLPQAKVYNGSCALGHGIWVCGPAEIEDIAIHLEIQRADQAVFQGETSTRFMKRSLRELVDYLTCELDFPQGVFLMTGTGLVPGDDFTLQTGDVVFVQVGEMRIENRVVG